MATERNVKRDSRILEINGFSAADGYVITDDDVLHQGLAEHGLLGSQYGYRTINPNRMKYAIENGTDRTDKYLNLCLYMDGWKTINDGVTDLIVYMDRYRKKHIQAVILIYDFGQIEPSAQDGNNNPPCEFAFKDPSNANKALKAIVIAKDFGNPGKGS